MGHRKFRFTSRSLSSQAENIRYPERSMVPDSGEDRTIVADLAKEDPKLAF